MDTHALMWWLMDNHRLPVPARAAIASPLNEPLVSVVSAFEIATKHRIGKLPQAEPLIADFAAVMAQAGFAVLPLDLDAAVFAGRHDIPHKDPFDRLLIAQSLTASLTFVTNEAAFDRFDVVRLWD